MGITRVYWGKGRAAEAEGEQVSTLKEGQESVLAKKSQDTKHAVGIEEAGDCQVGIIQAEEGAEEISQAQRAIESMVQGVQSKRRDEAREVQECQEQLEKWVGKCPLCWVRVYDGKRVSNVQHSIEECADRERETVKKYIHRFSQIHFDNYSGCFACGVPQGWCNRWREWEDNPGRFSRVHGEECPFGGVTSGAIAAISLEGPWEEIQEDEGFARWLEEESVRRGGSGTDARGNNGLESQGLKWFGKRVKWG